MQPPPSPWSPTDELADALAVAIGVARASDGVLLYANPRLAALLRVPAADLGGKTLDEAFGETGVHAALVRAARDDAADVEEIELHGRCPSGEPLWVLAAARRTTFGDEPGALAISFRDASLRRQLEGEVAALAELPEMNPGPVVRLDGDGTIALANAAARRLFDTDDLVGRRWRELCPGIDDDVWTSIVSSAAPTAVETEIGSTGVQFTYVSRDVGSSVFAFGADITERRQTELKVASQAAELAEVARFPDMNPGPVLRLDLEAGVLLANTAAREILGPDVVGRCWRDICPGLDDEVWHGILDSSGPVPIESQVGEREYVFHHRRDTNAELVFVFGADITQQKKAERALGQAEKMATLGTLAAGVAHELNNPAAATRRAAEQLGDALRRREAARARLEEAALPPDALAVLQTLEQRAREAAARPGDLDPLERADREAELEVWLGDRDVDGAWELAPSLVAQGLDAAALAPLADTVLGAALSAALAWIAEAFPVYSLVYEIGEGSARISEIVGALRGYSFLGQAPRQSIDLHEGIDNTLVILRSKLRQGITVSREYCTDMPLVPAYGSELNQVWTNLLDNAADAMGGEGEIVIRTRTEPDWAVIEIEDDGSGIPSELQSQVFDPFFTTKEPGKGTGLGLATTYSIVTEKHGGSIAVESQPGRTLFRVRLPLTEPPE
jgi:signal transduction histidine kinase